MREKESKRVVYLRDADTFMYVFGISPAYTVGCTFTSSSLAGEHRAYLVEWVEGEDGEGPLTRPEIVDSVGVSMVDITEALDTLFIKKAL